MNEGQRKAISISCTILAVLILAIAGIAIILKPASAAMDDVAVRQERQAPLEIRTSPERPQYVNDSSRADTSRDVHLSAGKISLDHYDVYHTGEGCVIALRFASGDHPVDTREALLGLAIRSESGDLLMSGGGSLWAYLYDPELADPVRPGPFTLWVTFGPLDLNLLEQWNGEVFVGEIEAPSVEVYLSDSDGITYAGQDGSTDDTSAFITIDDVR